MSFYKSKTSKASGIICSVLIVISFILQFVPYWTFEKTTIHIFPDANQFSFPIISDTPQPNCQAITIKACNDSINDIVWFPYKHENTIDHLHIRMNDKFKFTKGTLVTPHEASPESINDNFGINSLALAVVPQQIFGLLALILLVFKSETIFPGILAFLSGLWGVLGIFICPALKLGNFIYIHISISIAIFLISALSTTISFLASRKKTS